MLLLFVCLFYYILNLVFEGRIFLQKKKIFNSKYWLLFNSIGCYIVLGYEGPDSDLNATAPREMLLCGRGKDYILTAPSVAKEFPPCIYCMFYF